MKNLKQIVMFLAVATFSLTACKKEDTAPAKSEMISKKWTLTEYVQAGQAFPPSMLTGSFITFNAAGTYSMKLVLMTDSGSWSFNANETAVILAGAGNGGSDMELALQELTASSLKMRWAYNDSINIDMSFVP